MSKVLLQEMPGLVLILLLGCSHQDFSGAPVGFGRVRLSQQGGEAGSSSRERLNRVLAQWGALADFQSKDYRVGPGDLLEISVFALESPEETTVLERRVDGDGNVTLPWIGEIHVQGKTQGEIENEIARAYGDGYLRNPQVAVNIKEYRSHAVVVTGAAAKPGVYFLRKEGTTLLEAIAMAGGLDAAAGDRVIVMRSQRQRTVSGSRLRDGLSHGGVQSSGKILVVPLEELLEAEGGAANVRVRPGDIVLIPPREERYVYVLGYVQRPGAYSLSGDEKVDAVRGVALAGGLLPTARAQNSFLVRVREDGRQEVIPVDLVRMARGKVPPVYLQPGDTLVVGSGMLARLSEFIRPSLGAGVSYTPMP